MLCALHVLGGFSSFKHNQHVFSLWLSLICYENALFSQAGKQHIVKKSQHQLMAISQILQTRDCKFNTFKVYSIQ